MGAGNTTVYAQWKLTEKTLTFSCTPGYEQYWDVDTTNYSTLEIYVTPWHRSSITGSYGSFISTSNGDISYNGSLGGPLLTSDVSNNAELRVYFLCRDNYGTGCGIEHTITIKLIP